MIKDSGSNTKMTKSRFTGRKVDFEEIEERFFIMSAEPDVGDITACKCIQEKYGREMAVKIWEKWCKNGRTV